MHKENNISISFSKRDSNFELLRILAMLMIIASHYAVHGVGFENWISGNLVNRWLIAFFYAGGEIGVALFFMLSGYFLILKENVSVKKVFLTTVFYAWVSIILYLFRIGIHSFLDIAHIARFMLIPVTSGNWWFVTVYVILVLIAPYINLFLRKLNKRQYILILCASWFFLYVLGAFYGVLFAALQKAFLFYCIGAYFHLYQKTDRKRLSYLLVILCSTIFTIVFSYAFLKTYDHQVQSIKQEFFRICITGVCVPVCSVFLFLLFKNLNIGSKHIINEIASCKFGVYLLHDSPFNRGLIWESILLTKDQFKSQFCPLLALGSILAIFMFGVFIDIVRKHHLEPIATRFTDAVLEKFRRIECRIM